MAKAATRLAGRARLLHKARDKTKLPWEALSRPKQQLLFRLVGARPAEPQTPDFAPADVADWFMVSTQTARAWLAKWHEEDFAVPARGERRVRAWRLNEPFADLVRRIRSAVRDGAIA